MKIVFVSYKLCDGGAENVLAQVASELARRKHDVEILLYQRNTVEYPIDNNVKLIELGEYSFKGKNGISRSFNRIKAIRKIIKQEQPDFLIPFLDSMARETVLATWGLSNKVVATVRNSPYHTPESKLERGLRNIFCRFASAVWVQNTDQKKYFSKAIQKKTFVVANPVAEALFEDEKIYKDNVMQFITCGRLHEQKNHKMLIDAFTAANHQYPGIELSIYGVGALHDELQQHINNNGMASKIHLRGRTENVKGALLDSDCFILSSDFEGMPNALMEAMATGLPCISTNCLTGPSDLILNQDFGLLIPVNNCEKMTSSIIQMVEHPEIAKKQGQTAKKNICDNYSLNSIVSTLISKLQEI